MQSPRDKSRDGPLCDEQLREKQVRSVERRLSKKEKTIA